MKGLEKRCGRFLVSGLLALSMAVPVIAMAQQKALSIEELEAYIDEQKAVLEAVEANREETARKAAEVRESLAEQEARMARVEEELEALCKEQAALHEGDFEACRSQLGN